MDSDPIVFLNITRWWWMILWEYQYVLLWLQYNGRTQSAICMHHNYFSIYPSSPACARWQGGVCCTVSHRAHCGQTSYNEQSSSRHQESDPSPLPSRALCTELAEVRSRPGEWSWKRTFPKFHNHGDGLLLVENSYHSRSQIGTPMQQS